LPPGTSIDTRDIDHWVFPSGTALWKEFSRRRRKLETRYEEKRTEGTWFRTAYAWYEDQTTATENVTVGAR
jgi:hypothetical protein